MDKVTQQRRELTDHEQMHDAMTGCLPCKLCGGKAVITDAGPGYGYYIGCDGSRSHRSSNGCLIDERRISGWAYNVMDWWNRLMAATPAPDSEKLREAGGWLNTVPGVKASDQFIAADRRLFEKLIARVISASAVTDLKPYDAGLLGDGGGGDVDWWQDYLRAELDRAHEFYSDQIVGASA